MRRAFIAFLLPVSTLVFTGSSLAQALYPPPGGWGTNCDNWITYSGGPWSSGEICFNPALGWIHCPGGAAVVWPGLDIELWVEMECLLTWDRTEVDIHRVSNYDDFWLTFNGTSACNSGQWIITTPPTGYDLAWLPFVEDIFGRTEKPTYGTDIPLTWYYSLNGSAWSAMLVNEDVNRMFLVPKSDNVFTIGVVVDMAYHQDDGYYHLGGPGASICPTTPL